MGKTAKKVVEDKLKLASLNLTWAQELLDEAKDFYKRITSSRGGRRLMPGGGVMRSPRLGNR